PPRCPLVRTTRPPPPLLTPRAPAGGAGGGGVSHPLGGLSPPPPNPLRPAIVDCGKKKSPACPEPLGLVLPLNCSAAAQQREATNGAPNSGPEQAARNGRYRGLRETVSRDCMSVIRAKKKRGAFRGLEAVTGGAADRWRAHSSHAAHALSIRGGPASSHFVLVFAPTSWQSRSW